MPLNFKILALLAASLLLACGEDNKEEILEFRALEAGLDGIAAGKESKWLERLEGVKNMEFKSERIASVQAGCVSAYEKYADALLQLEESRARIDEALDVTLTVDAK